MCVDRTQLRTEFCFVSQSENLHLSMGEFHEFAFTVMTSMFTVSSDLWSILFVYFFFSDIDFSILEGIFFNGNLYTNSF